jgi:hypothetical protein
MSNTRSDTRKIFNYALLKAATVVFIVVNCLQLGGEINYRYQPFGSLVQSGPISAISIFRKRMEKRVFCCLGHSLDLTFTDKLFLTTFAQYNDRDDNVNLNARFQWRFKPASDFFVVYTENYFPEPLKSKNRALVLKITYWLNL